MDIKQKIKKLHLSKDSYVIVGSGILNALNIRKSHDIDMIVSEDIFQLLSENQEWKIANRDDGTLKITHGIFDCMTNWHGRDVKSMLQRAVYIDDIPYMSLIDVYEWKKMMGRQKDVVDIRLIEGYIAQNHDLLYRG